MRIDSVTVALATALLASSAALVPLSRAFVYGRGHLDRPILLVTAILLVAGASYAAAIVRLARMPPSRLRVSAVAAVSVALCALQLAASPIQESDFHRYLVDGGKLACGINPYAQPPAASERAPRRCIGRATIDPDVRGRVDYGDIRTPYPPMAQLWFAGAVAAGGPTVTSLRISHLGALAATLWLLALLLRRCGLNPLLIAVFGWAPLVFKEIFNSAHYDILAALLVTAAALLLASGRGVAAAAVLGLAAATKLFAAALLGVWLGALPSRVRVRALAGFVAVAMLAWLPFAPAGLRVFEGAWTFASQWTANAPVFAPVVAALAGAGMSPAAARATAAAVLIAALCAVSFAPRRGGGAKVREVPGAQGIGAPTAPVREALLRARAVLALLLVCGPAANPWYFTWLLPLVALDPRPAWLALVAAQPLYYARFYFLYRGRPDVLGALAWLEFAPFALLLARDALGRYRNRSSAAGRTMSAARSAPATGADTA